MKRYFRPGLFVIFFSLDFLCGRSQTLDTFIPVLKEKLATYCKSVPYEDIYIHSDRDTYIAGEYFWFNTYLLDRQSIYLSTESSYAYIELLDPDNQPVSQIKVRLEDGSGGGGFRLPDSLSTGEYLLRAYTNRMKNFLPYGCFMKIITVYNPFTEVRFRKKMQQHFPDNSEYIIDFFPEGGRLLNGFVNKVGVMVYYKQGVKRIFKGHLSDGINDTIASVVVDSMGIGSFEFFAEPGRGYKLVSDDKKNSFFLPVISQTGFSLSVKYMLDDSLKLIVNMEGVSEALNNYFYVVIQSRGNFLFGKRIDFSGKSSTLSIHKNLLKPGINQITIFNSGGGPVCNRLVYSKNQLSDSIHIITISKAGKREKINLEIALDTSMILKDTFSNFSLTISAINGTGKSSDISDYLITGNEYITPGGKGKNNSSFSKFPAEIIDNYLLSLKGIWIIWEDIIHEKIPEIIYPAEKGKQSLSGFYRNGNITETNNKIIYLSTPGKIPVFKYAKTDQGNRFYFAIGDNESSGVYVIQPSEGDNNSSIQIESQFSENYPESLYSIDSTIQNLPDEIVNWSVNYQLEKIYGVSNVGDTFKTIIASNRPIRFYGKPDQEIIMSDYINLPAMQEVFFELIPGVSIKTRKSRYGIYVQDPVSKSYFENPPALLVDGVIIDDPSLIIDLDPELVEKIDVIKGEYIVGDLIFSGIISVITKAGDFSNMSLPANAIRIRDNSYNSIRSYRSPDYSSVSTKTDRIPDFRNTLYWKHNLKPDINGKIIVDIFTSDFVSDYEVNLQGAAGGRLLSVRKTIRVE